MSRPLDIDGNTTPAPSLRGQDSAQQHRDEPDGAEPPSNAEGGAAPSLIQGGGMPGEPYCYVRCPKCRHQISLPFPRTNGPMPYVHRCGARLIVTPSRFTEHHRVTELPEHVQFEAWLREASTIYTPKKAA